MKTLLVVFAAVCILATKTSAADEQPAGGAKAGTEEAPEEKIPIYHRAEEIRAMAPCKGTVTKRLPCFVSVVTSNGRKIMIGSPVAGIEVVHFIRTLKVGQKVTLPDDFLEYQRTHR